MRGVIYVLVAVVAGFTNAFAQRAELRPCPKILSVLLTANEDLLYASPTVDADTRERYELRECGALQVYAFERGKTSPTLRVDTGDGYPPYLFHFSNVLVFQSAGGSADHVFVFQFERGTPRLVLRMATKDVATVSLHRARRTVTVSVPQTSYASDVPQKRPKVVVLKLE
jgi:hypothetical protein